MFFRFALILLLAAGCTRTDIVHRALGPDDPICATPLDLGVLNLEPVARDNNPARCFLQTHRTPTPPDDPVAQDWPEMIASTGRNLRRGGAYHLAFVEMADNGQFQQPRQLATVKDHLRKQRAAGAQNYVIAFVHGWRHDASLRDGDVKKFRILLGYARSALNTRCILQGTYCNASLTGVFVAWRGRAFAEPVLVADGQLNPMALIAAPTLFGRKAQSDRLGASDTGPLARVLDGIQAGLRLNPGRASADKFLIFGHSLGGNMLASLMERRAAQAIARHPARTTLRPPIGDLVVLINPASEARKWTALQQAMRARAGLDATDNLLTSAVDGQTDWERWARLRPWRRMFPLDQRPVYVSITSTGNWAGIETGGRPVAYDSATGRLFPLARRLSGARTPVEELAIGHLVPDYIDSRTLNGPAHGASHEFSVNRGTGRRATYAQSAQPGAAWCDPANGWLHTVRQQQLAQGWSYGDAWDYGLSPQEAEGRLSAAANVARDVNPASVQWRHSLNLRGRPNMWSVVSGRSPFWNVRALDTALREHAGYVNYPTWCAINQLVLDDVAGSGRPDATVAETLRAERAAEAAPLADEPAPEPAPQSR